MWQAANSHEDGPSLTTIPWLGTRTSTPSPIRSRCVSPLVCDTNTEAKGGSVCPKKNWKSARTRAAIARLQRTASTVALTVRALPGDRPSPATVVTRNVRLPRIDGHFAECSMERTAAPATLGCVHPADGAAENSFHGSRHRLSVWCLFLKPSIQTKQTSQLGKSLARQRASRFEIGSYRKHQFLRRCGVLLVKPPAVAV